MGLCLTCHYNRNKFCSIKHTYVCSDGVFECSKFYERVADSESSEVKAVFETTFSKDLDEVLSEMKLFLMEKNKAYGDSALNPVRIFSKVDALEQLKVRIDDKLSRFSRGGNYPGDNDEKDLLGYLVLLRIARKREEQNGV